MKKSKFLKPFSFASLALLMGAAGVFAFAPLGTGPSVAGASEMVDQINTKADGENIKYAPSALGLDPENDPVIYTTESGLEIKYGGATTILGGGNEQSDFSAAPLPSGKPLSGYPYFTMGTYNGYAVNWVIIGKSTTGIPTSSGTMNIADYQKLSTWQGRIGESPTYKYFFDNTYEATTPAGLAIKNGGLLNDYTARKIEYTMLDPSILSSVIPNDEISSGCVLAISENCLGTSDFNATDTNYRYGNRYRYKADQGQNSSANYTYTYNNKTDGRLYSAVKSIYENLNLAESQKSQIIAQKLSTRYRNGNSNLLDTFDTDGNTLHKLFPLAYGHSEENFVASQYLTSDALRVCYLIGTTNTQDWWTRSGNTSTSVGWAYMVYGNTGKFESNMGVPSMIGLRPACVIKLG